MLYRSARLVSPNVRKRRPVKLPAGPVTECAFTRWRKVYNFLSGHNDVIASFLFGAKECRRFSTDTFLKFYNEFFHFILFQVVCINSTSFLIIMSSPGQKRDSCGHVMAIFDNHKKCAHCREKGVGDDPCVKKQDCQICKAFTPSQIIQLATPTYKARKECGEQKKPEASSDVTPTLVDPSDVTLLGRVSTDKPSSVESTPKQKKKCSDGSPRFSKRKHSSKPTSDDIKSLDDKWSERFSRLEAMLLNQSFAVPVRPVSTAFVVPREHPFFDPGASTSVMFAESTGSSLAQTASVSSQLTATQPPLGVLGTSAVRDENGSATRPVQVPGTSDVATQPLQAPGAELATQPLQAPGAGTATQPPQAPGAVPEVLPTGIESTLLNKPLPGVRPDEFAGESDSEAEVDGELASPVFTSRVIYRKMRLTRTFLKMQTTGRLSEGSDPSWAGIRSLTTTIHLPPWMIILLPVPEPNQPAKCQ